MQLVLGLSRLFLFGMLFIAVANTYTLPLYTWNTRHHCIAKNTKINLDKWKCFVCLQCVIKVQWQISQTYFLNKNPSGARAQSSDTSCILWLRNALVSCWEQTTIIMDKNTTAILMVSQWVFIALQFVSVYFKEYEVSISFMCASLSFAACIFLSIKIDKIIKNKSYE